MIGQAAASPGELGPAAVVARLRGTALLMVTRIIAEADADGVYTCQLAQLGVELGVTAAAVAKLLQRLATAGVELRVPYQAGRDGRPVYAMPGRPYRLRCPAPLAAAAGGAPRADTRADTTAAARADNRHRRADNPAASYPQTAGQTRSDNCPTCGQRVDSCLPLQPITAGQTRSDNCPPSSRTTPTGLSGTRAPVDGPARAGGHRSTTRRTFPDGTAMDWDPGGGHGRGAAYYRCRSHLHLTLADGPGPACPRCAAVRIAHRHRRRAPTQPPPGQRPLVAAITGGNAPDTRRAAIDGCDLCDHAGRLTGGRLCLHDPDAMARTDAARAAAMATVRTAPHRRRRPLRARAQQLAQGRSPPGAAHHQQQSDHGLPDPRAAVR